MNFSISYSQKITSVDEAVKIAIENNPEIKTAQFNIGREEGIKQKAFNITKPQVFIEYEGVKGSISNFENRKIGVSQEFEFPLSYFLRADVQSSQVEIAKQEVRRVTNDIASKVKIAYLNLLLNNQLLEIATENLKIYNDFLFIAEQKYNAGATSNLEVLRARINKIKIENDISNLKSQIVNSQSELKRLLNMNYEIIPSGDLSFKELVLTKQELLNLAVQNNPEIIISSLQKEKFSNKMSLSKAELLPDLSVKYYNQKIGNDGGYWGIELGVDVPLWFWGEQSGNIKEADYEFQMASSQEITVRASIETILNQSFQDYQNNLRQLKFFNEDVFKETDEIFRQAKISYEEGSIDYTEYLQALGIVYDTRVQYMNAVYNYNKSIINLEKIIAGDIK
ncbi:MAG TPA: TolC family protein [Ignavibacteria bacterium]|nr:TolC family protein [Ignavibacteria bacterium]